MEPWRLWRSIATLHVLQAFMVSSAGLDDGTDRMCWGSVRPSVSVI